MAALGGASEYYAFDSLKWHFRYWTFMGVTSRKFPKRYQRILYVIHAVVINFAVQIYLPFHLIYGLFELRTARDILENMAVNITMVICTMKFCILVGTLNVFQDIRNVTKVFENKAKQNEEEYTFILEFKSRSRTLMKFYYTSFTCLAVSIAMSVLTYDSRRLLYPGYFPYDFKQNRFVYGLTVFYQWLTCCINVYANVHHDTFPGLLMFMLSQHLRILNLRISRIGYDTKLSTEENHQLLREAVNDHRSILRCYKIVNHAISKTSLALFLSSSFNIVCCLVLLIFFADNTFQKAYFWQLLFCYALETAMSCYYGSEFEANVFKTTESLYSCNWYEQTKSFKRDFTIFLQCSLKKHEFIAGGLIPVNKDTFARIINRVFSLFAVLNSITEKL